MTDLTRYPLEDRYETTLSQPWDGSSTTIYVNSTPTFTFPSWVTTAVVVNPGNAKMQVRELTAYSSAAKTLTVATTTMYKGASVAYTAQSHKIGDVVRISTNYQFWADLATAINSKVDTNDDVVLKYYASSAARDADIPSPVNGKSFATSLLEGVFSYYMGGQRIDVPISSTSTTNATTTVAGKGQLPSDATVTAGTELGSTWASNLYTNAQAYKSISLKPAWTTIAVADEFVINQSAVDKRVTWTLARQLMNSTELTAGENLTAGDLVAVYTDGSAWKTIKSATAAAQLSTITGLDTGSTPLQCYYLSEEKALVAYQKSADNIVYARVVTFSQRTPTVDAEQAISSAVSLDWFSIAVLSSSSFVCAYAKSSTWNKCFVTACSISWTSISAWTEANLADWLATANVPVVTKVTSTKFAVCRKNNTWSNPRINAGTVSWTVITPSAWSWAVEAVTAAWEIWIVYIEDDKVWVFYDDGTNISFKQVSYSWTVPSFGTPVDTIAGTLVVNRFRILLIWTSQLCLFVVVNNGVRVLTISLHSGNGTFDATNNYVLDLPFVSATDYFWLTGDSSGKSTLVSISETTSDVFILNMLVGVNGVTKVSSTTIATTATFMSVCPLTVDYSKMFVVRKNGSDLYYSVYWDNSQNFAWVVKTTTSAAGSAPVIRAGDAAISGLTRWLAYYVWDAWAVATSGTKRIWVATSTTNLFLN